MTFKMKNKRNKCDNDNDDKLFSKNLFLKMLLILCLKFYSNYPNWNIKLWIIYLFYISLPDDKNDKSKEEE